MAVVIKSKAKKAERKYPVQLVAPDYLNSIKVGEAQVSDLDAFVGKTAKINLMYITNNVKNQNIRLTFKVIDVKSGLAKTTVSHYEQIAYYLGRFVKAGSDLLEDSVVATSADGKKVRVKPFIVTKSQATGMILSALRKVAREQIAKELSQVTFDEFMSSVISGKVQNVLRNEVKKIFPLKTFEFKKVELDQ